MNSIMHVTRWLLVAVALAGALLFTVWQPGPDDPVDVAGQLQRADGRAAASYVRA